MILCIKNIQRKKLQNINGEKMKLIKKIVDKYSSFVASHPFIMLFLVIIITILAFIGSSQIDTKSSGYKGMLPEELEVMKAFEILEDNFGSSDSAMVAIEINPDYVKSNEPRDVREPEVIMYIDLLSQMLENTDNIVSVNSPSTLLKVFNGGILPKTKREINKITDDSYFDSYISKDKTMAIISIRLSDTYDADELLDDLNDVIEQVPKPPSLLVSPAGEVIADPIIDREIGPDMSKTSSFSMIGIVVVLLLLFRSLKYSFTPLSVIIVGIMWAMGYMGFIGVNMSSTTSGAISMIMGIGIDFGIQIITRYKQELELSKGKKNMVEKSIKNTLDNVLIPMATTTLAALIGFKAMSMGQLTFMEELGNIMSYGIATCFLAAITVVPTILVLVDNFFHKKNDNKISGNDNKKNFKKKLKNRKLKKPSKLAKEFLSMVVQFFVK
jgi:hydrophobe/amphiphile efflux-3 (HAE3) family protein